MNWIDKKYKDELGDKKFPHSLKQKGESQLAELLDAEFPLATSKKKAGLFTRQGLFVFIAIVITLLASTWYLRKMTGLSEHNQIPNTENPIVDQQSITEPQMDNFPIESSHNASVHNQNIGSSNDTHNQSDYDKNVSSNSAIVDETESSSPVTKTKNTSEHLASENDMLDKAAKVKSNLKPLEVGTAIVSSNSSNSLLEDKKQIAEGGNISANDKVLLIEDTKADTDNTEEHFASADEGGSLDVSSTINENSDSEDYSSVTDQNDNDEETVSDNNNVESSDNSNSENANEEERENENNEALNVKEEASDEDDKGESTKSSSVSEESLSNLAFYELNESADFDPTVYKLLKAQRFAMSIWTGYTLVDKTIDGGSGSYQALRKENEASIYDVPMGITMDYYLSPRWTLSLGIGTSSYGEKIDYPYSTIDTTHIDGRYVSPIGFQNVISIDSTRVIDSINVGHWDYEIVQSTEDTAVKNNNGTTTWRYIDVPILVGYRFGSGRFKPWVQTGFSLGIPVSKSYHYWSPSGSGLQSPEDGETKEASMVFSYQLNVGVDVMLTNHFSLRANAYSVYQLNAPYQLGTIKQNYYRIGISLGVAYNF